MGRRSLGGRGDIMVRRYVAISNVQRSLTDRRSSPMELIASSQQLSPNARRRQPKRPATLGGAK